MPRSIHGTARTGSTTRSSRSSASIPSGPGASSAARSGVAPSTRRSSTRSPRCSGNRRAPPRRLRAVTGGGTSGGVDSEVGRLRTVVLHRPGAELKRLTPRNSADLLFDAIPWVERAQDEHDVFAAALRDRGVEVLYLGDLLVETLAADDAREAMVA